MRLSKLATLPASSRRTLDFDLETVAAGYADPSWVPHTVTAWAYSWTDSEAVEVRALPVAALHATAHRRAFLQPLLDAIREADVLTGHNIRRYDLPVLNAEAMRLGLPVLEPVLIQDTIRLPRAKGFKKGQDNLGLLLGVPEEKMPLSWQAWQNAYAEDDLATVKERCAGDVRMHKQLREQMRERGWLESPKMWRPT